MWVGNSALSGQDGRELEPEAQHVALLVRLGAVDEPGARVQDRVVVDELDVAGLEVHVQAQVGPPRLLVEVVERGALERRQRHLALDRAGVDLVADVAARDHVAGVAEDRDRPLGHAALGQRRLAADVVEAVVEQAEILRVLGQDLVVHGHRRHDAAEPALDPPPQAQQADHVAGVGVIGQVGVGLVAAHVDVAVGAAVVVDVTEQIALRILVQRRAEVAAEAPEDQADVVVAVALHGQPAQDDEAAAACGSRPAPRASRAARAGEREVLAADLGQRPAGRLGRGQGAVHLGDLGVGEGDDPRRIGGEAIAPPGLGSGDRCHADRAHRRLSPVGRGGTIINVQGRPVSGFNPRPWPGLTGCAGRGRRAGRRPRRSAPSRR